MKSTILALFLSLVALHAQAAEAVPAEPGQLVFGLAVLFSPVVLGGLFFYGLFRKRVCSATPQRRRLTWAAVWTVAPFLYLLPFGGTDWYLITLAPLFPFAAILIARWAPRISLSGGFWPPRAGPCSACSTPQFANTS